MPVLSIIIVNYNVKFHLEQCLKSVLAAVTHIDAEIIVVDNHSVDGSVQMLQTQFPQVHLIPNKENVGFSKANNQAIRIAKGQYILLLNPDTIVQEDSFEKCIHFMGQHDEAGALGVKMIDGKGNFLPESKRAFPSPLVSFYKVFGLTKLFPRSSVFGQYHLSYLDQDSIHQVDVLSGAFMFIRKKVLDEVGWLDEDFFMYGEDIDLSYRITSAGYKNYYLPETTIIHYKGESTKKKSINYIVVFYKAMSIFAKKHFSKNNQHLFSYSIRLAIIFRAILSILARGLKKILLPVLDFSFIFFTFQLVAHFWTIYYKNNPVYYESEFIMYTGALFAFCSVGAIALFKGYKKPIKLHNVIKGILGCITFGFIAYAFLPESYRFSRAVIFLGSFTSLLSILLMRWLLHFTKIKDFQLKNKLHKRIVIVGNETEATRVHQLIQSLDPTSVVIGYIAPDPEKSCTSCLGTMNELDEIVAINNIHEVIFCAKEISAKKIIQVIASLSLEKLDFKISPSESNAIIGSNFIYDNSNLYAISLKNFSDTYSLRRKRIFDILFSLLLVPFLPIIRLRSGHHSSAWTLKTIREVLRKEKTWVGFSNRQTEECQAPVKPGVFNIINIQQLQQITCADEWLQGILLSYLQNYSMQVDLRILLKNL